MKVTYFISDGHSKVPVSPFNDTNKGKFEFRNKQFYSLKSIFEFMQNNYIMSIPLEIPKDESLMSFKRKKNLKEFFSNNFDYIILDLDEIKTKESLEFILNYFNSKDFNMILGKSRSFNQIDNFNLKGLLKINFNHKLERKIKIELIKTFLDNLQLDLQNFAKVDKTVVSNEISHQAPIRNFGILYSNNGKELTENDIKMSSLNYKDNISGFIEANKELITDNLVKTCLDVFISKGYYPKESFNQNGSLNFCHSSEKTKFGFFWFPSSPFLMQHNDKSKIFSIFNEIKDTEVGKEYIKNISKEKQKSILSNKKVYKNQIIIDERYLKVQDKKDFLNKYFNNGRILKIKSPMGTGKSNIISFIIKELKKQNKKILIVSNRISVAKDFAEKYDFSIYSDYNNFDFSNIVVQYDSLHRFDLKDYDYVILDEFISLLFHHRNNLTSFSNINAAKFYYILNNKKLIIADAFLTGYEDIFLPKDLDDSDIFQIENIYREKFHLNEFTDKNFFVSTLISKAMSLKENEFLSASFLSMNVLKSVEMILKEQGIKVVSLTSETPELTKELIFNKFKEENHNSFNVILYTPTLTVGVSNLNNVKYHFHYDTGMSADVISSLQMIKRSRKATEINFYIEEKQFYKITDDSLLNMYMQRNLNEFYTKKDKTLLVDFDYATGELGLTPLSRYLNKIEAFYNIFENNHKEAFKILLKNQFSSKIEKIDFKDHNFNINDYIKKVKNNKKKEQLELLERFSNITWDISEVQELKSKLTEKTQEEQAKIMFGEVQSKFKHEIPADELKDLVRLEIQDNFKFIQKIKNYSLLQNSDEYTRYLISSIVSSSAKSQELVFLKNLLKFQLSKVKLKDSYSPIDIKETSKKLDLKENDFEKFLLGIGFFWNFGKLRFDKNIDNFKKYL